MLFFNQQNFTIQYKRQILGKIISNWISILSDINIPKYNTVLFLRIYNKVNSLLILILMPNICLIADNMVTLEQSTNVQHLGLQCSCSVVTSCNLNKTGTLMPNILLVSSFSFRCHIYPYKYPLYWSPLQPGDFISNIDANRNTDAQHLACLQFFASSLCLAGSSGTGKGEAGGGRQQEDNSSHSVVRRRLH